MRLCPYCAEEIQDAAIICKHCKRDVPTLAKEPQSAAIRPVPATGAAAKPASRRKQTTLFLAVVLVLVLVAVASSGQSNERASAPSSLASLVIQPSVFRLGSNQELTIPAGSVQHYTWEPPPNQTNCHVSGRIEVVDGGGKDVQLFVMSGDDYQNFANGHEAKAFFQTGKTTAATLDLNTGQAGPMVLVISNAFSVLTAKRLRTSDMQAVCR